MLKIMNMNGNKMELPDIWKDVVSKIDKYGGRLAEYTHVSDFKNGILLVECENNGWIQILRNYNKFILRGLKMKIPDLNIEMIAYKIAGNQFELKESYEDLLKKEKTITAKKIENNEKQINDFYNKNKNFQKESDEFEDDEVKIPPEIAEKILNLKKSMLTNQKNK